MLKGLRWWTIIISYAIRGLAVLPALMVDANGAASAGDFILNYAIDANGKTGTGKLENCSYESVCEIRGADLNNQIVVHPSATGLPTMDMIVRGPPGCCYTADASQQFHLTLRPGLLRLAIYRRVWVEQDEFVRNAFLSNQRIGPIHLGFSQLR